MYPKNILQAEYFMDIALREAIKNNGLTSPNPSVGCVIVKNDKIIAKGKTGIGGSPHAEKNAIDYLISLGKERELQDASIYISLEPCCHHGKNPPCTDLIIKYGINKVFIATHDLDKRVNNKSITILKSNDIEVYEGILEDRAKKIYKPFFTRCLYNRPLISLKIASTIDGKIALKNNVSKWITNQKAREMVQKIRMQHEAILTGIGTIVSDNPSMNCRINGIEKKDIKIILDSNLKIDPDLHKIINDKNCEIIIFTDNKTLSDNTYKDKIDRLTNIQNVKLFGVNKDNSGDLDIKEILPQLSEMGISSLLVEAGASVNTSFLTNDLVDNIFLFYAPKIFGSDALNMIKELDILQIKQAKNFNLAEIEKIDENMLVTFTKKE